MNLLRSFDATTLLRLVNTLPRGWWVPSELVACQVFLGHLLVGRYTGVNEEAIQRKVVLCVCFFLFRGGVDLRASLANELKEHRGRGRIISLCTKAEFAVLGVDFVAGKRFARCLPEGGGGLALKWVWSYGS